MELIIVNRHIELKATASDCFSSYVEKMVLPCMNMVCKQRSTICTSRNPNGLFEDLTTNNFKNTIDVESPHLFDFNFRVRGVKLV
jgi:hypothetical protein